MQRLVYQLSLQQPCKISATASVIDNRMRRYFEEVRLDARVIPAKLVLDDYPGWNS
jgi:hypothetical protein